MEIGNEEDICHARDFYINELFLKETIIEALINGNLLVRISVCCHAEIF
jgi:hypothetical protein